MINKTVSFFSLAILLIHCSPASKETTQSITSADTLASVAQDTKPSEEVDEQPSTLIIHGKDIWVRSEPKTGQVVMKLNEGNTCQIKEKGEFQLIKGSPDYWYKIQFDGKEGWVFGSQTSVRLFEPINNSFTGSLSYCDENTTLQDAMAPASFSYDLKTDGTFTFSVAAGYIVTGIYSWTNNLLALSPQKISIEGSESENSGTITFTVTKKDKFVCLGESENKLSQKDFVPQGGCYCLN